MARWCAIGGFALFRYVSSSTNPKTNVFRVFVCSYRLCERKIVFSCAIFGKFDSAKWKMKLLEIKLNQRLLLLNIV